jgi:Matrixin
LFISFLLLNGCNYLLPEASPENLISTQSNLFVSKPSLTCVIRYKLQKPYDFLDKSNQIRSIKNGFKKWQKANSDLFFLEFSDESRAEIIINFEENNFFEINESVSGKGFLNLPQTNYSQSKFENNKYIISLNKSYQWTELSITKAVIYHTGLILGMSNSSKADSAMNPNTDVLNSNISKDDSVKVNKLFPNKCADADFKFLPYSFQLNNKTLVKLKVENKNTIKVSASGQIYVGFLLGYSTPVGLAKGLFNFPISGYNIFGDANHATIIYSIDNGKEWFVCGDNCEIPISNNEYLELILDINDNDKTDNVGSYKVDINY